MLVPRFWAEFRLERSHGGKSAIFRRWGWSDDSEAAALHHAEARALEAFQQWHSGITVRRRESKVAYNGAEGTPIREEIVDRVDRAVVTRNSYGALCLNTPDVLFADIDFRTSPPLLLSIVTGCLFGIFGTAFVLAGGMLGNVLGWIGLALGAVLGWIGGILGVIIGLAFARVLHRRIVDLQGGLERIALRRIQNLLAHRTDWSLRVYRTPAGLRLLATHAPFDPRGEAAQALFQAVRADPLFVRMCRNQNCFRARLTPKPWRVGVGHNGLNGHLVWPIPADRLAERRDWIERYDEACRGFAACKFLATSGNPAPHTNVREVVRYHDKACRAEQDLPLA